MATRCGWTLNRVSGSHHIYVHTEVAGNLVIAAHGDIPAGTLRTLIRKMGLTVDEFNRLKR